MASGTRRSARIAASQAKGPSSGTTTPTVTPKEIPAASSSSTTDGSSPPISISAEKEVRRFLSVKKAAEAPDASPEIKAIHDFFNFHPKKLEPDPKHRPSEGQKEPQFYDQHLHPSRALQRVVYCPEIEQDLRGVADMTVLDCLHERKLPKLNSGSFPTKQQRKKPLEKKKNITMVSENSVVEFYERTTAKFASTVAATLKFRQKEWSNGPLKWHRELIGQGEDAVADAHLSISSEHVDDRDVTADPQALDQISKLRDQVVMAWEFKSTKVGKEPLLIAIMELTQRDHFKWTPCEHGLLTDKCKWSHRPCCAAKGDHALYTPHVGPDALGPEADKLWQSVLAAPYKQREWKNNRKKYPESEMETARTHALHLIQQVWAQATKLDLTLIAINMGAFEIICRRDRAQQFLFISDIIEVWNTAYGQLHTGLLLAGMQDAEIRMSLTGYKPNGLRVRLKYDNSSAAKSRRLTFAGRRNHLALHFQENVRKQVLSGKLRKLCEGEPYIRNPLIKPNSKETSNLIRIVVQQHFPGTSVFRGSLVVDNITFGGLEIAKLGIFVSRGVFLKVADDVESIARLEDEYENYLKLAEVDAIKRFIPMTMGYFHLSSSSRGQSGVLVMENAGDYLKKATSKGKNLGADKELLLTLEEPFREALRAFHEAHLLHGSIRSHHLIVRKSDKRVKFISLALAESTEDDAGKEEEKGVLASIFPKEVKLPNKGYRLSSVVLSSQGSPPPISAEIRKLSAIPATYYPWIIEDLESNLDDEEDCEETEEDGDDDAEEEEVVDDVIIF